VREKKNTSEPLEERKRRNARGDGRGILLEIQSDVNILLYIELARQSEKVFSSEAKARRRFPPLFRRFCLPLSGLISQLAGKGEDERRWETAIHSN